MTDTLITIAVIGGSVAIILAVVRGEQWLRSYRYKRDQRKQAAQQTKGDPANPLPADIRGDVVIVAERCGCLRYLKPVDQDPCGRHERIHRENQMIRHLDWQIRGRR